MQVLTPLQTAQIIQTNLKGTLQAMWVIMLLDYLKTLNMSQNCTGVKSIKDNT